MRFDLEIDIVAQISNLGLDALSENIYGSNSIIEPVKWDSSATSINSNSGSMNMQGFTGEPRIKETFFASGTTVDTELDVNTEIEYDGMKFLAFNGGSFYSYNKESNWSSTEVTLPVGVDSGYYKTKLDDDVILDTIKIYTLQFKFPGYVARKRDYVFVEYDDISLDSTFRSSSSDDKYTILDNYVYLNTPPITYDKVLLGSTTAGNNLFALPEFPASSVTVKEFDQSLYIIRSGAVLFKNDTGAILPGEDVIVSYSVVPLISYKKESRSERPDIVFENTSISPKSLSFKPGTLCVYPSYGSNTIPTSINISKDTGDVVSYLDSIKVSAQVLGIDSIPLEGKEVTLEVTSNNAYWQDTQTDSYTTTTGLDGTIASGLNSSSKKMGLYIQKDWVKSTIIDGVIKGQIVIPYKLPILKGLSDPQEAVNNMYLYMVTANDPILGKQYNEIYETYADEYYSGPSLESYEIAGRKIAHVDLRDVSGKLYSRFIKPSSIEVKTKQEVLVKNLFVRNGVANSGTILPYLSNPRLVSSDESIVTQGTYRSGILPSDRMEIYAVEFDEVTVLTFEAALNITAEVNGFWLVTDNIVTIKATCSDGYVNLESEEVSATFKAMESEFAFTISGKHVPGVNSRLDEFGYLTVSDYIKNPFGLTSCSYYCIYSDAISKKCIHKNQNYHRFFTLDAGKVGCIHTPEYDQTISESERCPGVNARIVNPFVLPTEEG